MKKLFAVCVSLIALAFALPVGAVTAEKVQPQPDKAIATAPPTATRFILATADTKAKSVKTKDGVKAKAKAKKKAVKKEAKVKKTGTGFKLKTAAPVMA
jgi:pectin methylesterase-like acyl-CoA thioesterase